MKLTILVDNNTLIDQYFCGEPAVSFWLESSTSHVLFDAGYSDLFLRNALGLGIAVEKLTHLVLSHGHADHTGGLATLMSRLSEKIDGRNPMLVAHPNVVMPKYFQQESIGMSVGIDELQKKFSCRFTRQPMQLDEHLFFLGEVPSYFPFESRVAIGECCQQNGSCEQDLLLDDSALVYKSKNGLVVITGCSHSGICNIIQHAQELCGEKRIVDIIGGFHLLNASPERIDRTIGFLKQNMPSQLHACHCTDLAAKIALGCYFPVKEVGVGLRLSYDE